MTPTVLRSNHVFPSGKLGIGMIGVGEHGLNHNTQAFLRMNDAKVLAVCDVDKNNLIKARDTVNNAYGNRDCKTFSDFRDLLLHPGIDAVMISTPDHWHVPISVMAAQAGKDICCEKPTLTVMEGRILCDIIKQTGVVYQTSIEDRTLPEYIRMVELVRNGKIGELKQIYIELPREAYGPDFSISTEVMPPPRELDYEMWLGPAPYKPYSPARIHWNFRWCFDYSGGKLTDWGTHLFDTANWLNNTDQTGPTEIVGNGKFYDHPVFNTACEFDVRYKYANGVNMIIKSGGIKIRCEGSEGWLQINKWRGELEASSDSILKSESGPHDISLYSASSEHRNFIDCVKSGKETFVPVETGHRIATALHLGNISMILNRKIEWDPVTERCIGDEDANQMLSRESRDPWKLESIVEEKYRKKIKGKI